MASYEEHRNEQYKMTWHAHVEQERQQLSASVEETLAASSSRGEQWDDEHYQTSRKTTLIPPKLSLQSKVLPAVRPESTLQSTTGMQPIAQPERVQKESAPAPSRFRRFMQQLTAPFATLATPAHQEAPLLSSQPELPRSQDTAVLPEVHALPNHAQSYAWKDSSPILRVIDAVPSAPPLTIPVARPTGDTEMYRTAGRNAKVRLETTPMPVVKPSAEPTKRMSGANSTPSTQTHQSASFDMREPVNVLVRSLPVDEGGGVQKPASRQEHMGQRREEIPAARSVSEEKVHAPSLEKEALLTREEEQTIVRGSAEFAHGQRERMVKNNCITSSSIVQVMLSANPGPVALHYVTLQPQVGFTVHLTGPTSVKTPFNYRIM